jgi:hypothetical protein
MIMKTDLTYYHAGIFTTFIPETPQGETAWRKLAEQSEGTGKFLRGQSTGIVAQLRAAGYVVKMKRPDRATDAELNSLMAELMA